jgi:hypothetical protein
MRLLNYRKNRKTVVIVQEHFICSSLLELLRNTTFKHTYSLSMNGPFKIANIRIGCLSKKKRNCLKVLSSQMDQSQDGVKRN